MRGVAAAVVDMIRGGRECPVSIFSKFKKLEASKLV